VNITEACIKKPVLAWMLMAGTVVFGLVAASRIGISQFPDVDFPTISISVTWEGASPEVMEADVVEPIEEAVMQVEGVRKIESQARQGSASVTLEMDLERNVDVALQDVQAKVAQAQRRLPLDIDPPIVSKTNPEDQPIMWIGLSGPFSPQVLADTARYVVREKLQTVPGVGEVFMGSSMERNVRIWINVDKLNAKELTVQDVLTALTREHVELPAGRLETEGREINVRVLGEALDLETLRKIVIKDVGGAPIYLEDIALVEDGFEDQRRLSRVNGVSAQGLGIRKQRGSNAVAVARGVRATITELNKTLPDGMTLAINNDSTRFIEESVHEIQFELLLAVILTGFVCWLFLGSLSTTLNVVLAIPMSLLGTVAIIYFLGFTLNTFTLLALALSVGIVVDDAIMVLENIVRHAESGKDRVRAAREGTAEITFAAMAATLAVVAIFIPVIFMEGVIGRFFLQFGVTLSLAVLLSYLEAVTLAPARCSQILNTGREHRNKIGVYADRVFHRLSQRYSTVLGHALKRPLAVLGGAVVVFALSLFVMTRLGTEFVPAQDQSRILVRMRTPVGASLQETDRAMKQAEAIVAEKPEILRMFAVVGGGGGGPQSSNLGIMYLTLVPPDKRKLSQDEIGARLRRELNALPGVNAVIQDLSQAGFTAQRGMPVEFSVQGPDWNQLVKLSSQAMDQLRASGLVTDLDSNYDVGMPELRIIPDRARAADVGVSSEVVATTINALVGGIRAGKYSTGGRRVDVRVKLLAQQRSRPEDIGSLLVRTASGALVPLSSLVRTEEQPVLQAVTRSDRQRAITVFANIASGHTQGEALKFVAEMGKEMPPGYRIVLAGASVTFTESMGGLLFAVFLGILVAYMILASQFNSFLSPVTVLTILPLSIVGASFALLLSGHTLNIFSMIGILLLLGIVKKNSIILVDYANEERNKKELDAAAAMLHAGPVRLRPILMTSIATLMAALPAALALGPGSEIRAPMAVAVIGGLIVSTALSLFVVPAFYVVADRARARLRVRKTRRGSKSTPGS
jgi:hydrophobe/amphiphile efflux-1 (HAE1) family protein